MGEQHCGERQDKDVLAGPHAKQECEARRTRRDRREAMDESHATNAGTRMYRPDRSEAG
jgi:hypothetical protein